MGRWPGFYPGRPAPPPLSAVTLVTSSLGQLCKMTMLDRAQALTCCSPHAALPAAGEVPSQLLLLTLPVADFGLIREPGGIPTFPDSHRPPSKPRFLLRNSRGVLVPSPAMSSPGSLEPSALWDLFCAWAVASAHILHPAKPGLPGSDRDGSLLMGVF